MKLGLRVRIAVFFAALGAGAVAFVALGLWMGFARGGADADGFLVAGVVAGSTDRIKAIRTAATDTGGIAAPFSAFLVLRGIQTLHVRMDRHVANTREVVAFLADHPQVESVSYPELPDHPDHELAREMKVSHRSISSPE